MTQPIFQKAEPVNLRDLGLDERWLQDKIEQDTSILGLGDLVVIQRERSQPTGGRIDFLMYDPDEAGVRYEIEVMLGRVDESHIIRTIEYWDIERQRFPNLQHRAVIIAEDLTTRFLNVISLLNRAIPIIAIQMSAFRFDNKVVLHFVKLLDLAVESTAEDEGDEGETVDRAYWARKASPQSLGALDKLLALVPAGAQPAYKKYGVAVRTTGRQFCWIHPRGKHGHVIGVFFVGSDGRDSWVQRLGEAGFSAETHRNASRLRLHRLDQRAIGENEPLLRELMEFAEAQSRGE